MKIDWSKERCRLEAALQEAERQHGVEQQEQRHYCCQPKILMRW